MTKEELLETVTMKDMLLRYGLHPNRGGYIRCPFHQGDNTASLKCYEKDFHCFGCGAHGDVIRFVQLYEGVDFLTAFRKLGGTVPKKGQKPKKSELWKEQQRKKQTARRAEKERRLKEELDKANEEIGYWLGHLKFTRPMTDAWAYCYNHWQLAVVRQMELLGEDEIRF